MIFVSVCIFNMFIDLGEQGFDFFWKYPAGLKSYSRIAGARKVAISDADLAWKDEEKCGQEEKRFQQ